MTFDVVDSRNETVGAVEVDDAVFGGAVRMGPLWEAVVHEGACDRQGTHATKTRGKVSGSGKKPWRQKGTGRARVGEIRNPLWRTGGTVFGPQPRSYAYRLPRKVARGALRSALTQKISEGAVRVVDGASVLRLDEPKTKLAAARLAGLGVGQGTVLVDVTLDANLELATRNLPQVMVVRSRHLTARDVLGARAVVVSQAAFEHLAQVLGS